MKLRVFLFLLVLFPAQVFAGNFSLKPLRIYINNENQTGSLTLINHTDNEMSIQIDPTRWYQDKSGNDIDTEPTEDILIFPKIVTVEKGSERVIRIAYQGEEPIDKIDTEKAYRLMVSELPGSIKVESDFGLRILLKMNIPLFVEPEMEEEKPSIEGAELSILGDLILSIKNNGKRHFQIDQIIAKGQDEAGKETFSVEGGGWYVLAGTTKRFPIKIPKKGCLDSKNIDVSAELKVKDERQRLLDTKMEVDKKYCPKQETSGDPVKK